MSGRRLRERPASPIEVFQSFGQLYLSACDKLISCICTGCRSDSHQTHGCLPVFGCKAACSETALGEDIKSEPG